MSITKDKIEDIKNTLKEIYVEVATYGLELECSITLHRVEDDICSAISWLDVIIKQVDQDSHHPNA